MQHLSTSVTIIPITSIKRQWDMGNWEGRKSENSGCMSNIDNTIDKKGCQPLGIKLTFDNDVREMNWYACHKKKVGIQYKFRKT